MSDDTHAPLEGELIPADAGTFDIAIAAHPLHAACVQAVVLEGCSLRDLGAGGAVLAFIDGERIEDLDVIPRPGQSVLLKAVPQGGGDTLRLIATIAVIAAAAFIVGPGALALTGAYQTAAFAGLTLVGQLAITALIPPAGLSLDRPQGLSPFRGIQRTNNRIAPYEVVPKLYGTHRLFPPYAALPVPVSRGGQQDFLGLYCVGWRNLSIDIASLKLGETPLANFVGAEYRIWDYARNEALEDVFALGAVTDSTQGDLKQVPAVITRTTQPNTQRVDIEVGGGPIGWFGTEDGKTMAVGFTVEYRPAGSTGAYTVAVPVYVAGDGGVASQYPLGVPPGRELDDFTENHDGATYGPAAYVLGTARDTRTYTVSVAVNFPSAAQWELRISRVPGAHPVLRNIFPPTYQWSFANQDGQNGRQEVSLIRLRYTVTGSGSTSATVDARFAYVALKLKASDQLNGAVDDFNLLATGVVPVWNGSAFVMQASSSPAWAYRDVLLGSANGRPVTAAKIDDATLIQWAADCAAETPPREFNGAFDGLTSVFEALKNIASAGRAAFSMRDGKYSVVRDVAGKTPVQLFTPRNLWQFSAAKSYSRLPHALKIKFHDRAAGWAESERIVYADGYSLDGSGGTTVATLFEQLSLFGCTHKDQAFKDGRYLQAVGKLRPETFSWNSAVEHLVCQRGDVVRVQHDAMLVGLGAGRIIALDANTITLDETVLIESGKTYQVRIRRDDATTVLQTLTNAVGETRVLTLSGGVSAGVKLGDVVAFGESGLVSLDALITAIEPGADLTATIRAVPYSSPGVHTADTGTIPAYDPVVTQPQTSPPAPTLLNIDSSAEIGTRNSDGTYTPRIFVSYAFNQSEALITGVDGELRPTGATNWAGGATRPNNGSMYFEVVSDEATYDLRLRGRNDRGTPGPWTEVYGYTLETARVADEPAIALLEQRNNPATPNQDLSTVVATVTPPNFDYSTNGSFNAGDTGWTHGPGWSIANDAANARGGSWLAKRAGQAGAATYEVNTYAVPVVPGDVFTANAYFKGVAGTDGIGLVSVFFYDAAGVFFAASFGNTVAGTTGVYTLSTDTATVPASAATARVAVGASNTTGTFCADDVSLYAVSGSAVGGPGYNRCDIDYRKLTDTGWTRIGPTDAANQARVILNSDGASYEFRARAVNDSDLVADFGATAQITLSTANGEAPTGDPDAGAGTDAALNVPNLRILGQLAAVTSFTGPDVRVEWDAPNPPAGQTLRDYRVRVIDPTSGNPLRVRYVLSRKYVYTLADNTTDAAKLGYTGPLRAVTVEVIARTTQGKVSASAATKTVSNPAPVLPGDFARAVFAESIRYSFSRPTDGDYVKAIIYASQTNGFTAGPTNKVYEGLETNPILVQHLRPAGAWYSRVELYDVFGAGSLSAQYSDVLAGDPSNDVTPPTTPGAPTLTSAVESAQLYTISRLSASWAASTDNLGALFYEVEYWTTDATKTTVDRTANTSYTVSPARAGALYSFRVRAIDYSGNASAFAATATHTVVGDTVAPANVTGATATGGLDKIVVEWVNPTDADFLSTLVYRGTTSGFTANAGSLVTDSRGTTFVDAEVVFGTSYYYKFATRDVSGNTSAASAATGPAASTQITSANADSYIAAAALKASQMGFQFGGGNVLLNSSFELDSDANGIADSWTVGVGGTGGSNDAPTYSLPTVVAVFGTKAQRVQATNFTGTARYLEARQVVPWPAGQQGVLTATLSATSGHNVAAYVQFRDAANAVLATATLPAYVADGNAARYELRTAAAPAGTTNAQVFVGRAFGTASAETLFLQIDNAQFEAGEIASAYAPRPDEILAGSIQAVHIDDDAITTAKIAAGAVTTTEISDNAISTPKIIAGAVTAGTIAAGAVIAGKIAANAVTATEIAANSITAIKILAGAIVAGKIAANAVEAGNIAANAITTRELIVGDFTNLAENSGLEVGDVGWNKGTGWTIVNDAAEARTGSWVAKRAGQAGAATYLVNNLQKTVEPGDKLYATAYVKGLAGTDGAGFATILFYNAAGAFLSGAFGLPGATTSYTLSTLTATVPAGAAIARLALGGNNTTGTICGDDMGMFRVAGSALIADASIITAKIADLAVTTAKIDNLAVTNAKINDLDAGKITAGFIAAARIQAGTITADKLSVTQLSAIAADLGAITAGTITGATIQTAASGARAVLDTANGVRTINASAVVTSQLKPDGSGFLGASPGNVQWSTAGAVTIAGDLAVTGTLQMTAGAIYGGKASFASTTAGYWLGYDGGVPKFKIGGASNSLAWDGTGLTVTGVVQTAASGQRVVLTSGDETEFYDDFGSLAASIGIKTAGGDVVHIVGGLPHSGTAVGNATQQARYGVGGYSCTGIGVFGRSISVEGVLGYSGSGTGVWGRSVNGAGVKGSGLFGGKFEPDSSALGGSIWLPVGVSGAPTHTASTGVVVSRDVGGVNKFYLQTAGGGGTGSTWVLIGNAV